MNHTLFEKITVITEEYLGPAAERFVARQITFHLEKSPQDLTEADIPKLIEWTRVTFSLLTDDREAVQEYIHKMEHVGDA